MSSLSTNNPFAIIVSIRIAPGSAAQFLPLIIANAEISLRKELACQQFQIIQDTHDPDHVLLYEVYDDAAAFDAHAGMDHAKRYNQLAKDLIVERTVQRGTVIEF